MIKLTPARKSLLQMLERNAGRMRYYELTPSECATGTNAEKDGLCEWVGQNKVLWITEKGRAALQNEGK